MATRSNVVKMFHNSITIQVEDYFYVFILLQSVWPKKYLEEGSVLRKYPAPINIVSKVSSRYKMKLLLQSIVNIEDNIASRILKIS